MNDVEHVSGLEKPQCVRWRLLIMSFSVVGGGVSHGNGFMRDC